MNISREKKKKYQWFWAEHTVYYRQRSDRYFVIRMFMENAKLPHNLWWNNSGAKLIETVTSIATVYLGRGKQITELDLIYETFLWYKNQNKYERSVLKCFRATINWND